MLGYNRRMYNRYSGYAAFVAIVLLLTMAATAAPMSAAKAAPPGTASAGAGSERAPFSVLGFGIFLGQPTGITFAVNLTANQWLDAKAAWDFSPPDGGSFAAQGNYIFAFPGILVVKGLDIPPFVGFGVTAGFGETASVAIRVPFGLDLRIPGAPIEVFLELGLGMYIVPATRPEVSGGLGIRYRL